MLLEELHLTPDHAFNLARYLKFSPDEREYFLSLVEVERAASLEYRQFHKQKIAEMKRKFESIQERTGRQSLVLDALNASYFSSWLWCHSFLDGH